MNFSLSVAGRMIRLGSLSREDRLVVLAVLFGTAIKLWLALTTVGTNDLPSFYLAGRETAEYGTIDVYRVFPIFNHPPLVTSVLWILDFFAALFPRCFPFVFRLPMILADVGSAYVLWKFACLYFEKQRALAALTLFALNPVLMMISGFHGNTDTVFIFFVLLAAYAMVFRGSCTLSAVLLGLAFNIKIVPVILIPAFFFWIPCWRKKLQFLTVMGAIILAGFGFHLAMAFADVLKKVFLYAGVWGIWGLGRIFMPRRVGPVTLGHIWYPVFARYAMLFSICLLAFLKSRQSFKKIGKDGDRGLYLLEAIAWSLLIFLILTPGFGVQYLSWLVGPGIFLGLTGLSIYTLVASVFLFRVYTFWSAGFPWVYADSNTRGQWVGTDMLLDRTLWIVLVVWAAVLIFSGVRGTRRIGREATVPRSPRAPILPVNSALH